MTWPLVAVLAVIAIWLFASLCEIRRLVRAAIQASDERMLKALQKRQDPPESTSGYIETADPPSRPPSTYTYSRDCAFAIDPEAHGGAGSTAYTAHGPENRVPGKVIWTSGKNAPKPTKKAKRKS